MMNFHPLTVILFSLIMFLMVLVYSHPLYILSILVFLLTALAVMGEARKLKTALRYGIYTSIMIILINPFVSGAGKTIIYKSPRIPVVGKIKITLEALAYGTNMAVKLICILFIFVLYETLVDEDDNFSFFSKYAHKFTIILSMTTNIIHRLRLEITRVKDVMILRGVNFNEKSLIKRVRSYYPILKVILISALEGSLDRAEALYSREYGKYKRTSYSAVKIKTFDCAFIMINIILLALLVLGSLMDMGNYTFYPTFEKFEYRDLLYLAFININLFVSLLLIWGCKKWKSLKLKT